MAELFRAKGQINLEFLAAALIYLGALGALVLAGQGVLPEFTDDVEEASLNLEARQISTQMLTSSGRHTFPAADETEWERNDSTIENTVSFGLANDFLEVEREKIEAIQTGDIHDENKSFNYTQFREVTDVEHQYQFNFTWMPVIDTSESFTRGEGEDNLPQIQEPQTEYYNSAGNTVYYGSETLDGSEYYFLVTSHNGVYNTTYVSSNRDFQRRSPLGVGDTFDIYFRYDEPFRIERFQNRENEPGAMLVLSQHLKNFGARTDSDSRVITMDRYAVMDDEPLKVRILAW